MILYDSQSWTSLLKLRGSVYPRAILYALPAACVAGVVKFLEMQGTITLNIASAGMPSSTVYSGFTFVLGFVLVFRASQSYARYWLAATSIRLMQAEWLTACSTLVAFSKVSKKQNEEIMTFAHTAIRLFAMMHAMALEEIADLSGFPLLDIQAFSQDDLRILSADRSVGRRVELVFSWIQGHIINNVDSGLMNVPSPLLTRVFQNLGNGLISYYSAQQVVIWPFPFAYAQMNSILVFFYMLITPMVVCSWTTAAWSCAIFTFVSVVCMVGLDLIAIELENPFGDDPNDLPVLEMQNIFNKDLTMLVDPLVWNVPKLQASARTHSELLAGDSGYAMSLQQYSSLSSDGLDSARLKEPKRVGRTISKQQAWARQGGTPRQSGYSDVDTHDVLPLSSYVEPKDGGASPLAFRRANTVYDRPPAKSSGGSFDDASSAGRAAAEEPQGGVPAKVGHALDERFRQQQELLEQHREVSEEHLRRDSAFQERVLSLLEQMRSCSADPLRVQPSSPLDLSGDLSAPRGASLWPCQGPDPSRGHASSARSSCGCRKAPGGVQAQGAHCPPG
mmetsp:Transcript_29469/g.84350  ORF Transcript_29469/g.84350 Transcript_29469/m.84350 type:complete len:562 (-) Transcript_29469:44-1729(-)